MSKVQFGRVNPRDPVAPRFARTLDETRRDPYAWWEADVPKVKALKPYRWGHPKIGAPAGFEARLQEQLLAKPPAPVFATLQRFAYFAIDLARAPLRRTVIDEANPLEYTAPRFKRITYPTIPLCNRRNESPL